MSALTMAADAVVGTAVAPIEFSRVSRWYGQIIALNDVTTRLQPGVTGLLGPNGAGKSTFLKLAAGQIAPDQGEVSLAGGRAFGHPERFHRVGLCPETDSFWETLSGWQFVTSLLRLSGFTEAEVTERATKALEAVDLMAAKDRRIGGYSKGMRQRVKMAQALAHDPEVLLLDEPFTGMDPVNRRRMVDLIRRLGREGKTVLVSSHILYEVESLTRQVLLIHNGRIVAEGDIREIRDLMDEHPHTVAFRASDPRRLASALVGRPHVLSIVFGAEGEWVTIQTARPDELYGALTDVAVEAGVSEMYSPDEDLESVFRYLVNR